MKTLVAMSGGVDSSVAAAMLVEAGHDVTGVHLRLAEANAGDDGGRVHGCCGITDADDARRVAQVLDIPFYVWNMRDRFTEARGRLHRRVREGTDTEPVRTLQRASEVRHAARPRRQSASMWSRRGITRAPRSRMVAGASVAVSMTPRTSRTCSPGRRRSGSRAPGSRSANSTKPQVRELAARINLRTANKPESYDICFIPDGDTAGFLDRALGEAPGPIVDPDGNVLGEHDGVHRFTIGQRRGLGLATHERLHVLELAPETATVVVGAHELLRRRELDVDEIIWTSCPYTSTITWKSANTPLPTQNNPRVVFERLFGDTGTTDAKVRLARARQQKSILDSVTQEVAQLQGALPTSDRTKLIEYLAAIRDVEQRIQMAEAQSDRELPLVDHPPGIPSDWEEHIKLMIDLQVLAYQCDLTRVITFMVGREHSGMTYPQIGVPDAHHPISHYAGELEKIEKVAKINAYHARMFAYYLEKLRNTQDGDGTLLDHMTMMYGAGIADSNSHDPYDIPIVMAGGGTGFLKGGRHIRFKDVPLANLHLTLMDQFGVEMDKFGDSTGRVDVKILSL